MVDVGAAPMDRYVVLEHLSEGGMGAIYVGKKLGAGGFEMEVVLKQLLPELTQHEELIDLFLREAKLSATLDHANIVHTIDLVTTGGEYFIVMEYLPGGDLRALLKKAKRRGKQFSPAAAIHVGREVLSALAYAHVKRDLKGNPLKLIHRDVSPSNILVSYAGEVKLTDFGIAKAATHNSLFYRVKGKIGYMSPEQARSEPLDHRSDLYSLAVCMYEVLTGERLFVHAGLTSSAGEIYAQSVPLVSRKVPGLTTELDAIMSKALALSPDARFQTAGEFQEALTRCAHRNGLLVSAPEVARELRELCGPPDQWREEDDDLGHVGRAETEVYAGGGDDEEDDDAGAEPSPIHGIAREDASSPSSRPRTEMAKLQGVVELTSIINTIDLESPQCEAGADTPLDFDLDPDPELDLGPDLDSGPDLDLGPDLDSGRRSIDPGTSDPGTSTTPSRGVAQSASPAAMSTVPGMSAMPWLSSVPAEARPPEPIDATAILPRPRPPTLARPAILPASPVPRSRPVPHLQVPRRAGSHARKRSLLRPWMVIVAIVIAAAVAAVVVAMSGSDVTVQRGH